MPHHYSGPDFGFPHGDARLIRIDLSASLGKTVRCPRFSTPLSRWTRSWSPDRKLAFNGKGWDA